MAVVPHGSRLGVWEGQARETGWFHAVASAQLGDEPQVTARARQDPRRLTIWLISAKIAPVPIYTKTRSV